MSNLAFLHNHGYNKSEVIEYKTKEKEWSVSITDPTFYTPVGSMVRKLNAQDKVSFMNDPQYFDFPDGVDNGATIPLSRYPGTDIAEYSQAVKRDSEELEQDLKTIAKKQSKKASESVSTDSLVVQPEIEN